MNSSEPGPNWKLDLRYGRLITPYKHFTVVAEGRVGKLVPGFECRPGPAFMGMKTWATSAGESADMAYVVGAQIGFEVTGRVEVFDTEPIEPPSENPRGYGINFTPYDEK
ncbi:MAG TPA: hypothetical protein VGJ72_19435 [Polaromonas sp.]|jgi:hypothetical protein